MGMTYTDSYETRKAVSDMTIGEVKYKWEYIATSPIDGRAYEVNATAYRLDGEQSVRLGYGSYAKGNSNVRFDTAGNVSVEVQAALSGQFYADLVVLIS